MQLLPPNSDSPHPRQLSKASLLRGLLAAVLVLAAYVGVAMLYNRDGSLVDRSDGPLSGKGLQVSLVPIGFNANSGDLSLRVLIAPQVLVGFVDRDELLTRTVQVNIDGGLGTSILTYRKGQPVSTQTITLNLIGDDSGYPFDRWSAMVNGNAEYVWTDAKGEPQTSTIPILLQVISGLPNWDIVYDSTNRTDDHASLNMEMTRSVPTRAFALLMLGFMVLLIGIAIWIALLAFSNRRVAEIGMLTWLAGLLFALPSLRHSMPDSPEIGVAIDMYVFLWTLLGAAAAAVLVALAWWSQSRARLLKEVPAAEPTPEPAATAGDRQQTATTDSGSNSADGGSGPLRPLQGPPSRL